MIEKNPPKGVSFSNFICTFAAPCYDFRLFSLKSASNLNDNLNCSKELEHYAS